MEGQAASKQSLPDLKVNPGKLEQFMGQVVGELGAAMNAALVLIGEKLGLYKAMAGAGPMTSAQLAEKTRTDERYVREWLSAQAAGGFVTYDAATKSFTLPDEQAFALAVEDSPAYLPGAFQIISAVMKDEPKILEAFRTGEGVGWELLPPTAAVAMAFDAGVEVATALDDAAVAKVAIALDGKGVGVVVGSS